jgi:hypothetical protein
MENRPTFRDAEFFSYTDDNWNAPDLVELETMTINVPAVALGRARMWANELEQALAQPRTAAQQQRVAALICEADGAFRSLLECVELYAQGLAQAGEAASRDGLPLPHACGEARALRSVARTLLSEIEERA